MLICPIDGEEFQPYEGMRYDASPQRLPWCEKCQDAFDAIDWDAVAERRNNCDD